MAKVYLFRKLPKLERQQALVCEQAIASVLSDVFKGKASTIFNYGDWPVNDCKGDQCDSKDLLGRILNELFRHVYGLELKLEVSIAISHMLLNAKHEEPTNLDAQPGVKSQFVATPHDVYSYMEGIIRRKLQSLPTPHEYLRFTLSIQQNKLPKSGELKIIHLPSVESPESLLVNTPMSALLKVIAVLDNHEKSHLRYDNTKFMELLHELMGADCVESTVLINYTMPKLQLLKMEEASNSKLWRALYLRERRKSKSLNEKLSKLQFWCRRGKHLKVSDLTAKLQQNFNTKLELELEQQEAKQQQLALQESEAQLSTLQQQMSSYISGIKGGTEQAVSTLLDLQQLVTELGFQLQHSEQQLAEKNQMLNNLNALLAQSNDNVQQQRLLFKQKLSLYAEMIKRLWQQQNAAFQTREQQREQQLYELFNKLCAELHNQGTIITEASIATATNAK
ncbi:CG10845 [Drosophila busckii]|uniref:CG10845 n=1 Tax=Drosophila busckii TaxID=30019 RepID=A0A0M4F5H3_DROBS|nr:kinesin heavy chain [Drosophila busckii]ALC46782.1 CG10845 [Drosophila busckii]